MARRKKHIVDIQYTIDYDYFDDKKEVKDEQPKEEKKNYFGKLHSNCVRVYTHTCVVNGDVNRMSRIIFSKSICERIAKQGFSRASIAADAQKRIAVIVLNSVGGQCNICKKSNETMHINSVDLVDTILAFSNLKRETSPDCVDFEFYENMSEDKTKTLTLFVLPKFLSLNK